MKISDIPRFFQTILLILPTPPFLWEKSEPPPFLKISKTQPPLLYKACGGGGGSNYEYLEENSETFGRRYPVKRLLLKQVQWQTPVMESILNKVAGMK